MGPSGVQQGRRQTQFWGICIPSAAGTPGQAWDLSHGGPLQSTPHLWQRAAPHSGRQCPPGVCHESLATLSCSNPTGGLVLTPRKILRSP